MNPKAEEYKRRAHDFFMEVICLCRDVTPSTASDSIVEQLIDSAGSAESNYRAACKARTRKEFIAKVGVAAEEADESLGWLEALRDAKLADQERLPALIREANELTSIFVASHKTSKARLEAEEKRRARRRRRRPR
jgi:four helix bundle protein